MLANFNEMFDEQLETLSRDQARNAQRAPTCKLKIDPSPDLVIFRIIIRYQDFAPNIPSDLES